MYGQMACRGVLRGGRPRNPRTYTPAAAPVLAAVALFAASAVLPDPSCLAAYVAGLSIAALALPEGVA